MKLLKLGFMLAICGVFITSCQKKEDVIQPQPAIKDVVADVVETDTADVAVLDTLADDMFYAVDVK